MMDIEFRVLTDHRIFGRPVEEELDIVVVDKPGQGGANHEYLISCHQEKINEKISFQNGPIKEFGVNGVTHEVLLTIIIDRLRSFQKGPFSCRENAIALTNCEEALMWLQKRTHDRIIRGVEGTNNK